MSPARRTVTAVAVALVVLVAASAAFAFLDFSAAEHATTAERQVAPSATGDAEMTMPDGVVLAVVGDGAFRERVQAALVDGVEAEGVAVEVTTELRATYDRPVLLVGVRDADLAYNPVTPSATVVAGLEYALGGNVTQYGQPDGKPGAAFDPAVARERLLDGDRPSFRLGGENRLFRGGTVRVTDETTGIASRPAYRDHVAGAVADEVVEGLLGDAAI